MYLQRLVLSAQSQEEGAGGDLSADSFLDDSEMEFHDPLAGMGGAEGGTLTSGWRREMKEVRAFSCVGKLHVCSCAHFNDMRCAV